MARPLHVLQTVSPATGSPRPMVGPVAETIAEPIARARLAPSSVPPLAAQAIVTLAPGRHPAWVEYLYRPHGGTPVLDAVRAAYAARGHRFDLEVIDAALGQSARLRPTTRIAINVHPVSLRQPGFVEAVLERARRHHVDPARLVLELVEFDGAIDLGASHEALEALKRAGCAIALDDFGPGAPNFDVLAAGLVDWIKLDRSLCAHVDRRDGARRVLAGLVAMVRHAGPGLVAEGVERPTQMRTLRELGVVCQQGYLFNRPTRTLALQTSRSTH
ncbi:EAL domain-containing protein [Halomonas denitrificans]|nr:EAL domain-containing protein [Halomonas denitrificans]